MTAAAAPLPWLCAARRTELFALARDAWPDEACGYLQDERVVRCRNAADDARRSYRFDDQALVALTAALAEGATVHAFFHSHPDGELGLSVADRRAAGDADGPYYPAAQVVIALTDGLPVGLRVYTWKDSMWQVAADHRP